MGSGDSVATSDFAVELERATRGLLDVSVTALGQMEETVSPAHLRALQSLERRGSSNVSELAEAIDVLPSTASRLSDRLAAAGLITRGVSPSNRRATLLELTAAGREVLAELVRARTTALQAVANRMNDEERDALLHGTRAFTAAHQRLASRENPSRLA